MGRLLDCAELKNLCRSEVRDLYGVIGGKHEVGGLDVAMDHVSLMGELKRAAGLLHDSQCARQGKRVPAVEQRLQALSLDQLHSDVVQAVFFTCVENHHDVRMGQ